MATTGGDILTLLDTAKRTDPDGKSADIAEVLMQSNPILQDIPWYPGNLVTGNRSTIRTGLPTVSLRRLNQGVLSSKSTTSQIEDGCSIIEAWSTLDAKLAQFSPSPAELRFSEAKAFIESMGQKAVELFFYGSVSDDDREFNGFTVRYNTLIGGGNQLDNVLDASGSSANAESSIWLVGWGENKVFGMYPRNSTAGLQHNDLGLHPVQQDTEIGGAKLLAYEDQWTWDCGLVVKDWRYVVRICNVDVPVALAQTGDQATTAYASRIINLMIQATYRIPNLDAAKMVFYMPRSTAIALHFQAMSNASSQLTLETFAGKRIPSLLGIPIRPVDQLLYTEAVVV